jgi:GNAT superfamily N-acetyltransferase
MNSLQILPALPEDVPLMLQFIRELAEHEQMLHLLSADEETLHQSLFVDSRPPEALIAKEGDQPVGWSLFYTNFSTLLGRKGLFIEDLYIRAPYRGKGYGKALIHHICQIAAERNCGRVEWLVMDRNTRAIQFYKKMGATPMTERAIFRLTEPVYQKLILDNNFLK